MTDEHNAMERLAAEHEAKASDCEGKARVTKWVESGQSFRKEAGAHRRCAQIIRHQIECEA